MESSGQKSELIRCESLRVAVSGRVLFQNVNRSICAGTITHVHGANGAGKSTLLRVLAGRLGADAGRVVRNLPPNQVFYLPQLQSVDVHLPFTLGEVSRLDRWPSRDQSEQELPWFPSELHDRLWNTASGGERMRALLARALMSGRRLLLLDEPFNHLDAVSVPEVIGALVDHVASRGGGVVLVAHDKMTSIKTVETELAPRVSVRWDNLVIADGVVAEGVSHWKPL